MKREWNVKGSLGLRDKRGIMKSRILRKVTFARSARPAHHHSAPGYLLHLLSLTGTCASSPLRETF